MRLGGCLNLAELVPEFVRTGPDLSEIGPTPTAAQICAPQPKPGRVRWMWAPFGHVGGEVDTCTNAADIESRIWPGFLLRWRDYGQSWPNPLKTRPGFGPDSALHSDPCRGHTHRTISEKVDPNPSSTDVWAELDESRPGSARSRPTPLEFGRVEANFAEVGLWTSDIGEPLATGKNE